MPYMSGNNQSAEHPSREREQLKTFRDKKLIAKVRAGAGMAYLVVAPVSALGFRDRLVPTSSTFSTSWILNGLSSGEVPGITLARRGQRQQTTDKALWDAQSSAVMISLSSPLPSKWTLCLAVIFNIWKSWGQLYFDYQMSIFPAESPVGGMWVGKVEMFEVGWNLVRSAIDWQFRFIS